MKAISLTQPWASLVALGEKLIETRSWYTRHRGQIAIHAAKGFPGDCAVLCEREPFVTALGRHGLGSWRVLPTGAIVAVAELEACLELDGGLPRAFTLVPAAEHELAFGDYTAGRYGFLLARVRRLQQPVPVRGALSIWDVPADVAAQVLAQL